MNDAWWSRRYARRFRRAVATGRPTRVGNHRWQLVLAGPASWVVTAGSARACLDAAEQERAHRAARRAGVGGP